MSVEDDYHISQCAHCASDTPKFVCSSCFAVGYCNAQCQKDDWIEHHSKICFNIDEPDVEHLASLIRTINEPEGREIISSLMQDPFNEELIDEAIDHIHDNNELIAKGGIKIKKGGKKKKFKGLQKMRAKKYENKAARLSQKGGKINKLRSMWAAKTASKKRVKIAGGK
jgi:hypothetical protein